MQWVIMVNNYNCKINKFFWCLQMAWHTACKQTSLKLDTNMVYKKIHQCILIPASTVCNLQCIKWLAKLIEQLIDWWINWIWLWYVHVYVAIYEECHMSYLINYLFTLFYPLPKLSSVYFCCFLKTTILNWCIV